MKPFHMLDLVHGKILGPVAKDSKVALSSHLLWQVFSFLIIYACPHLWMLNSSGERFDFFSFHISIVPGKVMSKQINFEYQWIWSFQLLPQFQRACMFPFPSTKEKNISIRYYLWLVVEKTDEVWGASKYGIRSTGNTIEHKIINQDVLHSRGNSTQYSEMTYMGKES